MANNITSRSFSLFKGLQKKKALRFYLLFVSVFAFLYMGIMNDYIQKVRSCVESLNIGIYRIVDSIERNFLNFNYFMSGNIDKTLFDLHSENIKLHREIENLKNLKSENENLHRLLSMKKTENNFLAVAKVITFLSNSFARSALLDLGASDGVSVDDIVRNEDGLVGRIIEVNDDWSSVLLITDASSSIPVKIGEVNAIVNGDNSNKLQIAVVQEDIFLKEGDVVETSGYGGVFVEKIPVGKVKKEEDKLFIVPFVNFNAPKYVYILRKATNKVEASFRQTQLNRASELK